MVLQVFQQINRPTYRASFLYDLTIRDDTYGIKWVQIVRVVGVGKFLQHLPGVLTWRVTLCLSVLLMKLSSNDAGARGVWWCLCMAISCRCSCP